MGSTSVDVILPTVEAVAARENVDLEDLQIVQQGRRRIIRVVVDADGGVNVDRCADVSRALGAEFDKSGVLGEQPYTLEVSSRGVSRPLTLPRHWRRNHGRLVKITLFDGDRMFGRIVDSDDEQARLDVEGTEHDVAYADIRRAKVQVEFTTSLEDPEALEDADVSEGEQ